MPKNKILRYARNTSGFLVRVAPLTTTEKKRARRAERARKAVKPGITATRFEVPIQPADVPAVQPGDRAMILQKAGVLFPNAKGTVVQVKREHDMRMALLRLDRKNAAGQHIRIWMHVAAIYVLASPGAGEDLSTAETRPPRPLLAPEHRAAYNELLGHVG